MPERSSHILDLARKGAEVRYHEPGSEMAALLGHFPYLCQGAARKSAPVSHAAVATSDSKPVRKGSKMSAAAKKAVSLRMKKCWADGRAPKAKNK